MTEYSINYISKSCCYRLLDDNIILGMENSKLLTNDELIEFTSDCLIHEYTHKIMNELFSNDVSKLFDAIEYLFRNEKLHKKTLIKRITYQTYIKRYGFIKFLLTKHITNQEFINAKILCNTRKEV